MKYEIDGRYFYPYDYEDEEWRRIKGFPQYHVSNYGRIRNKETKKILKPQIVRYKNSNTLNFKLYNHGRKKTVYIRKLMREYNFPFVVYPSYSEYFQRRKGSEFIYDCF